MAAMSQAYAVLRQVCPGAGGRSKAGGYDLVTADTPSHRHQGYLVLLPSGIFRMNAREASTLDPTVLCHLLSHNLLEVK
jgi:hypothetical protein